MAGTTTHPITYSTYATKVQPLDWNQAWIWVDSIVGSDIILSGSMTFKDDEKALFGTGEDASITYTGSDLEIRGNVVGTGNVDIFGAYLTFNQSADSQGLVVYGYDDMSSFYYSQSINDSGVAKVSSNGGMSFTNSSAGSIQFLNTAASGDIFMDPTDKFYIRDVGASYNVLLRVDDTGAWWDNDNFKVYYGEEQDASIMYDGTNLIINPKEVGSGYLQVSGQTLATDKIMFTQTDGNEYIDSLADGYMDYGATTAHRFTGNVGIGATTPYSKLDIGGLFDPSVFANHSPQFAISSSLDKITGMSFRNTSTGTISDSRFVVSDTTGHYLAFSMPNTTNTQGAIFGLVRATTDFIFNAGGTARDMGIGTAGNTDLTLGTNNTARVTILNTGNVGIGVTNPGAKLEVSGNIHLTTDSDKLLFGAASDASIMYDGTDLVINPAEVGTGVASISGDLSVSGNITATGTINTARVGFAAKTSNTSINATSWTIVSYSSEIEDTDSAFDGTKFTVPAGEGGMYSVSVVYAFSSVSDGNKYIVAVSVNSTTTPTYLIGRGVSGGTALCGAGGNAKVLLSAGDILRTIVYVDNATSGYSANAGYCTFSAYKM